MEQKYCSPKTTKKMARKIERWLPSPAAQSAAQGSGHRHPGDGRATIRGPEI